MKTYTFYSRYAQDKEGYYKVFTVSRLKAAKHFAELKQLSLKDFLQIYQVSR